LTPLPNCPCPHHYCFGFALSLALAPVPYLVLDGANVAVSPPSTIAVAIAVPVAIPDTITIAFPPRQKFSKLEYIFDVQHTYFITFQTGIKDKERERKLDLTIQHQLDFSVLSNISFQLKIICKNKNTFN
jgi:hypothetical protein